MPAARIAPTPESLNAMHAIADEQAGLLRWSQATEAGLSTSQLRTLLRDGTWRRLRHGVLVRAADADKAAPHLLECAARWFSLPGDVVVSHDSAAVLHGFELVTLPAEPTFTIARKRRGALRSPGVGDLPAEHRTSLNGLPLTTLARTLVDILRVAGSRPRSQELADEAARLAVDPDEVAAVLGHQKGWPGIRQAREAWDHASVLSESPLESRCRVWFRDGGLPEPEQQVAFRENGRVFARVDFWFPEHRTVVEADGRVKYDDPSVLWKEKRREDRLREQGAEVVRATWADGDDGGRDLVVRVERAFARARRAA